MENGMTTDQTPALVAPGVAAGRQYLMAPQNLTDAMKLAEMLSKSAFVPRDYANKPGDVLAAIQFGAELGLPPLQALQGIAVINGRPSVWGDAALAIVQSSGTLASLEETLEGEGDQMVAICVGHRIGDPVPKISRFSVADAKKANLWGKAGPWTNYPPRMLKMRARAYVLRDGWADFLKGLAIREVQQDVEVLPVEAAAPMPRATDDPPLAIETTATDGSATVAYISEPQRKRLFALAKEHGKTTEALKDYLGTRGIDSTTRIPVADYDSICNWVEGKDAA